MVSNRKIPELILSIDPIMNCTLDLLIQAERWFRGILNILHMCISHEKHRDHAQGLMLTPKKENKNRKISYNFAQFNAFIKFALIILIVCIVLLLVQLPLVHSDIIE